MVYKYKKKTAADIWREAKSGKSGTEILKDTLYGTGKARKEEKEKKKVEPKKEMTPGQKRREAERAEIAAKPHVFKDKRGRMTGATIDGKDFLGLSHSEVKALLKNEGWDENLEPLVVGETPSAEQAMAKEETMETEFREAGVFKEPVSANIVEEELENLGVIKDIAISIIPGLDKSLKFIKTAQESTSLQGAVDRATRAEVELTKNTISTAIKSEISVQLDGKINTEEKRIIEQGLGGKALLPVAGLTSAVIGGTLLTPVAHWIGSDKMVKNLEMAVVNLDSIGADITKSVNNGLPVSDAFAKMNRIENIINGLEAQIQSAAIESANVRISLRGREISTKILSSREKLQANRLEVAQISAGRAFGEIELTESVAFLQELKEKEK